MSDERHFELRIEREGDERTICVELDLAVSPETVWRALTEAEELTRWFPFQAEVEPGEGGVIRISWDGAFTSDLEVLEWKEGRALQTTWSVPGPGGTRTAVLSYRIEGRRGGTRLHLVHSGFPADDSWDEIFDSHVRGWSYELRSLRHYTENHAGRPRRLARVRRPLNGMAPEHLWSYLWSGDGLVASGAIELRQGASYDFTMPSGHRLEGRILVVIPPHDLGATVESMDRSLLRVGIERWSGVDGPLELSLWLATWGVAESEVLAIERSWEEMLDEIVAKASAA